MNRLVSRVLTAATISVLLAAGAPIGASPRDGGVASASVKLATPLADCGGGAVQDDGSVETGYSFVPSAVMGQYVQRFERRELPAKGVDRVCVCWLRTRSSDAIDFEVVFYADEGGRPVPQPYAAVAASASAVPKGVPAAGRFWEVDVSHVTLAPGASYIGVRWNPKADPFFFVCTDTSEATRRVDVYSMEDRAPRWASVLKSRDPIFKPHRAILVRAAGPR